MRDTTKQKKILLVDDEQDILNLVETVLRKEGFDNIRKAETGMEAIDVCKENIPDIIVLDIMLPDMDGHEVCKKIREFSNVPIIFLSAKSDELDRLLSFAVGGDDYMPKPFSPKEVVYRINAIFKRIDTAMGKEVEKTIIINDLEIIKNSGVVKKKGEEVILTAIEFKLLIFLVENVNVILPKSKILENVWGIEFEGMENTLMVHIRHLREKIEDDPHNPRYIVNLKNLGYKFVG